MHFLEFFSIVERDLDILNPTSHDKLMLVGETCGLQEGARVLDVGSGKGYLLRQWAARWGVEGTGLELNPTFVAAAREKAEAEGVAGKLTFIEGPARDFAEGPSGFDIMTCIGAPFAIGSFEEALMWMLARLKPGGALAIGDEFLPAPLPPDLVAAENIAPDRYRTLSETLAVLERCGLELTGLVAATTDDWDRYASGSWRAAHAWARENPEHPARDELLSVVRRGRDDYLRYGRHYASWGVFVARPKA